jgi:hypothetical protein
VNRYFKCFTPIGKNFEQQLRNMDRFHHGVKDYQTFLNLSVKLKSALPGNTTGGITDGAISGETGLKVSLLEKEKSWSTAWHISI